MALSEPQLARKRLSELRTPTKPIILFKRFLKTRVDPDGDLLWSYSAQEGRLIFGRSSLHVYRVQAGVRLRASRRGVEVKISPGFLELESRASDTLALSQKFEVVATDSSALTRKIRLSNLGKETVKAIVISLHDPTSINFRGSSDPPGGVGVNAFNRGDHVAIDDLGDVAGARVIGCSPAPRIIYMTKDKTRALELLERGELSESTAGISGPIMVLTQHELEIVPRGSAEVTFVSVHNSSGLEGALSTFTSIISHGGGVVARQQQQRPVPPIIASSSQDLNFASAWALSRVSSIEGDSSLLDRLETIRSLSLVNPELCQKLLRETIASQRKNGALPHSLNESTDGVLETSLFLMNASLSFRVLAEKKEIRACYRSLRRAAKYLRELTRAGLVHCNPALPQGWRRELSAGYPTGILAEVNLGVAGSLRAFGALAALEGKGSDAALASDASENLIGLIREKLLDDGVAGLVLNIDEKGRLHREESIDEVLACYRLSLSNSLTAALARRMLEKDFETGFGPRTLPTTSPLFVNGNYFAGQLGGYWTRAALASALLSYRAGYAELGSAQLLKVSRLVHDGVAGLPGEFPYWFDPENRGFHSEESDPVAAARLIESVFYGEMGLSEENGLDPPRATQVRWLFVSGFGNGGSQAFFLGREGNEVRVANSSRDPRRGNSTHGRFERLVTSKPQVVAAQFSEPGNLVCVGSSSDQPSSCLLTLPLRDPSLSKHLMARLEEFNCGSGRWVEGPSVRLQERMTISVKLPPYGWKMLRLHPPPPSSLS